MADIFNPNELIFDKAVGLNLMDLADGKIFSRVTKLEDPTFTVTSEADEITDAEGATIAKLLKNKKATFSASNSLFSLDLYAAQNGVEKEMATSTKKKTVVVGKTYEVTSNKITLDHTPKGELKYIYKVDNGNLGEAYTVVAGSSPTGKQFTIATDAITLPTDTTGKFYIQYETEVDQAVSVKVVGDKSPDLCSVVISAIFADPCNQNIKYAGYVIGKKAQLDPSSIEMAWSRTGKHSIALDFIKDYCDEDGELFDFVVFKD